MDSVVYNECPHIQWSYVMINLQSSQVKRTPQNSINEFIIRKLSPLAVGVDKSRNMPEQEK